MLSVWMKYFSCRNVTCQPIFLKCQILFDIIVQLPYRTIIDRSFVRSSVVVTEGTERRKTIAETHERTAQASQSAIQAASRSYPIKNDIKYIGMYNRDQTILCSEVLKVLSLKWWWYIKCGKINKMIWTARHRIFHIFRWMNDLLKIHPSSCKDVRWGQTYNSQNHWNLEL